MKFIPYDHFTLQTHLSPEEVKKRLSSKLTAPPSGVRLEFLPARTTGGLFTGQITGDRFTISRTIDYRNSFLPRISGVIDDGPGNTSINIKMQPHIFVIVFLVMFIGITLLLGTAIPPEVSSRSSHSFPAKFIPFGMAVFAYLITMGGFWWEARRARTLLMELFEARPL